MAANDDIGIRIAGSLAGGLIGIALGRVLVPDAKLKSENGTEDQNVRIRFDNTIAEQEVSRRRGYVRTRIRRGSARRQASLTVSRCGVRFQRLSDGATVSCERPAEHGACHHWEADKVEEMTPEGRKRWAALSRGIRKRRQDIRAFIHKHGTRPFYGMSGSSPNEIGVTRELRRLGWWRVTWFRNGEPQGHVEAESFRAAVKLAVTDFGLDLSTAKHL